ncbi:purine nucleoside phosphorylase 1-like [Convolutriloba macropyga]|uniref:purine nucleoside phosphorylase 1-like n=1 Tax=Convolutriloba macropyga TaxID=536237 RepID=UPI003F526C2E
MEAEIVSQIVALTGIDPSVKRLGIITGTGLQGIANVIRNPLEVSYDKIEKFPKTQVKGHPGRLIFGQIAGKDVVSNVKYYISFCSIKKLSLRLPTIKLG